MSDAPTAPFQPSTPVIRGGDGAYVLDDGGACYLDCTGAAPLGHGHATVVEAVTRQLHTLHTPVAAPMPGLSTTAMANLSLPGGWRSMLLCGGEQALEAVATMAARFTGRDEIVLLTTGLQGRTQVALSISGLPDFRTRPTPVQCVHHVRFGDLAALSDLLRRRAGHIAAVIAEPIATVDVTIPTANYWRLVQQRAEQHDALLVFDESNTALCWTGRWFAAERWPVTPDAIVIGQSLANGLPIGAVLCDEAIADGCDGSSPANPVAVAAAEAVIGLVSAPGFAARVQQVGKRLLSTLQRLADRRPQVSNPRGAGLLLGVDVPGHEFLLESLRDHGVLATMTGQTLVLRPPLTIDDAEVTQITDALYACL